MALGTDLLLAVEEGTLHPLHDPLPLLITSHPCIGYLAKPRPVVIGEAIAGHPLQRAVTQYGGNIDKVLLLADPDPGRRDRHLPPRHGHALEIVGTALGQRRQILANQHHQYHGGQYHLQHRHDDIETGSPRRLQHHQL